jgi:hypothetical protein
MVVEEIIPILDNLEKLAGEPKEDALEELEDQIKKSFEILKEGKAKYLFSLSSRQYKKGEIDLDFYWSILTSNVRDELEKGMILHSLASSGPAPPNEISKNSGVPLNRMYKHIVSLLSDRQIVVTGETEDSLTYSRGG